MYNLERMKQEGKRNIRKEYDLMGADYIELLRQATSLERICSSDGLIICDKDTIGKVIADAFYIGHALGSRQQKNT